MEETAKTKKTWNPETCGRDRKKLKRSALHEQSKGAQVFDRRPLFWNKARLNVDTAVFSQMRDWQIIRALAFFLQIMLKIIENWQPDKCDVETYGLGHGTTPRYAALFRLQERMSPLQVKVFSSLSLQLFVRAPFKVLAATESSSSLTTEVAKAESEAVECQKADNLAAFSVALDNWIELFVLPRLRCGLYCRITGDWPHWEEVKEAISKKFFGVLGLKKMQNLAWERLKGLKYNVLRGSAAKALQELVPPYPNHIWDVVQKAPSIDKKPSPSRVDTERSSGSASGGCCDENLEATSKPDGEHQLVDASTCHAIEEAAFREWLGNWSQNDLTFIPEDHRSEWVACIDQCWHYIRNFANSELHSICSSKGFPTSFRVWTSATVMVLSDVDRRGLFPKFITAPSDKNIKRWASEAPAHYQDPGNVTLDLFFHTVNFWRLSEIARVVSILKTAGSSAKV